MKRCSACGEHKPAEHFSADGTKRDGKASTCKPCAAARARRHYYDKVRDRKIGERRDRRRRRRGPEYVKGVMKHCSRCGDAKPWDAFRDEPRALDGKASACTECVNAANRAQWLRKSSEGNAAR